MHWYKWYLLATVFLHKAEVAFFFRVAEVAELVIWMDVGPGPASAMN
jgi:hypothetical protein